MDYGQLYEKNYYYEDSRIEGIMQMMSAIKKKNKDRNLTGIFQGSTIKYFCFHLRGRYLCYYDKQPVIFI